MSKPAATPRVFRSRPPAAAGGFTLVETLLVLAVIALLAMLLLPGINSLLRSISDEDPDRAVWDVITSARGEALAGNRTVRLRYDSREKTLLWGDDASWRRRKLPADLSLQFLQPRAGDTVLLGGVLVETQEISGANFYPDGTCDRFRVQLRQGKAAPQVIEVDPWTCAPILPPAGK